jgi:hypothetical protein
MGPRFLLPSSFPVVLLILPSGSISMLNEPMSVPLGGLDVAAFGVSLPHWIGGSL